MLSHSNRKPQYKKGDFVSLREKYRKNADTLQKINGFFGQDSDQTREILGIITTDKSQYIFENQKRFPVEWFDEPNINKVKNRFRLFLGASITTTIITGSILFILENNILPTILPMPSLTVTTSATISARTLPANTPATPIDTINMVSALPTCILTLTPTPSPSPVVAQSLLTAQAQITQTAIRQAILVTPTLTPSMFPSPTPEPALLAAIAEVTQTAFVKSSGCSQPN